MESLKKWLKKYGYPFEVKMLTGGYQGIFVELEIIENHHVIGNVDASKLLKYIKRYKLNSEYRGHYTSLLIWE